MSAVKIADIWDICGLYHLSCRQSRTSSTMTAMARAACWWVIAHGARAATKGSRSGADTSAGACSRNCAASSASDGMASTLYLQGLLMT